jgi:subtilisin family serine protease
MRLSGTSFAAPIVAGAAAQVIARHPTWTPDMVKGALMQKARFIPEAPPGSAGVGELNAQRSADLKQAPNPNLALERFVIPDSTNGGIGSVFDAASWSDLAKNSGAWDAASWSDASWSDVSWSDASWSDVSWSDVSWSDVSWSDVLAAADVTREDAAGGDNTAPSNDYELSQDDLNLIAADPDLAPTPPLPPPPPPPIPLP